MMDVLLSDKKTRFMDFACSDHIFWVDVIDKGCICVGSGGHYLVDIEEKDFNACLGQGFETGKMDLRKYPSIFVEEGEFNESSIT